MNRTIIIVKVRPGKFVSVRLHWMKGQAVEDWVRTNYDSVEGAARIIAEGHRSEIKVPYGHSGPDGEPWVHKTLREATAYCEHRTRCYWNGGKWAFTHSPP